VTAVEAVEAIKRFTPAALKVTLTDGTERPVAVARAGNRWARIIAVLDKLSWSVIECLDKDGRVLGIVESEPDEDDDQEDDVGDGGDRYMARVLTDVMRATMRETRLMFDAQLKGQAELLNAMTDGMRHLSDTYRTALQVQQAHLMAPPGPNEGEAPEVMRMMQMAMMMLANGKGNAPTGGSTSG